jgi:hypothetical protein
MKTSFLTMVGVLSLVVNLAPFTGPTHAVLRPQPFPSLYVVPAQEDAVILSQRRETLETNLYTDATRLWGLVQELQTLPVGKQYGFYQQMFEQQGYLVLDNYTDARHWEFTLEKERQTLRLTIAYNAATGRSTGLTASGPRLADVEPAFYSLE